MPKSEEVFKDPYDDVIIENPIDESQYYRGDKNVPKEDAQFEWTPKMVKELKKCKENIIHFAENHFWIVNLDRGKMKIELYKAQKKALKALADNRFVCVLELLLLPIKRTLLLTFLRE